MDSTPPTDTLAAVRAILLAQLGQEPSADITPTTHLENDLGIDSLDVVGIIMAVEERWAIEVADDAWADIKTAGDLVTTIDALRAAKVAA